MKLFYKPGACSLSPHIVLQESGLAFTLEKVDLMAKTTENGANFLQTNPKGQVPALLLDNGTLLTEGAAIVQYLADQVPNSHLLAPVGDVLRYQTIAWLNYIATELHKSFVPLFVPSYPEESRHISHQDLKKKFHYVNDQLAGKQWICGPHFSVADAYLFTVLRWAYAVKVDLQGLSHLESYSERIKARPAVVAALQAEGI